MVINALTFHYHGHYYQFLSSFQEFGWYRWKWRRVGSVLLIHPSRDKPHFHQSVASIFAARWCWQVFLHCLTGNACLLLVQGVLWQNMILLPRVTLDCAFATVAEVFNVPPLQVTYILTSCVSASIRDTASDRFPKPFLCRHLPIDVSYHFPFLTTNTVCLIIHPLPG